MDRDAVAAPIFSWQDTTDYTGNSVTFTNVKAALKIEVATSGTFTTYYDNLANISSDPDFNGSSTGQTNEDLTRARTQAAPIQLPTNTDGTIKEGEYRITYTVTDGVTTVSNVITIDTTFDLPVGNLDYSVSLVPTSPSIVVTDETNYVQNNLTPTKTRTLKLYYPADSGLTTSSTSAAELTTVVFATGEQIATLSTICNWDYSDNTVAGSTNDWTSGNFTFTVNDTVTARVPIEVSSDTSVCDIFCCLKDFEARVATAQGNNPTEYQRLASIAGLVSYYNGLIASAFQCGATSKVNDWVQEIKDLVDCKGDCTCSNETPTIISAVAGSSITLGNVISGTTTSGQVTVQNNNLINKTYNSSQQDFIVFLDGLKDNASFVSSTGTVRFSGTQPAGVFYEIWIAK